MRLDRTSHTFARIEDVPQLHEVREHDGRMLAHVSRRATGQTHEVTSRLGESGAIVTHTITEIMRGDVLVRVERVFVGFTEVYSKEV